MSDRRAAEERICGLVSMRAAFSLVGRASIAVFVGPPLCIAVADGPSAAHFSAHAPQMTPSLSLYNSTHHRLGDIQSTQLWNPRRFFAPKRGTGALDRFQKKARGRRFRLKRWRPPPSGASWSAKSVSQSCVQRMRVRLCRAREARASNDEPKGKTDSKKLTLAFLESLTRRPKYTHITPCSAAQNLHAQLPRGAGGVGAAHAQVHRHAGAFLQRRRGRGARPPPERDRKSALSLPQPTTSQTDDAPSTSNKRSQKRHSKRSPTAAAAPSTSTWTTCAPTLRPRPRRAGPTRPTATRTAAAAAPAARPTAPSASRWSTRSRATRCTTWACSARRRTT